MGVSSMVERSAAAFIARMGATLEPVIKALPATQRNIILPVLLDLPLMKHAHSALNQLVQAGVPRARLGDLLSTSWTAWALPDADGEVGDDGAQLLHDLTAAATAADDQDLEAPEAEAADPVYRNMQSALCDYLAQARSTLLRTQLTAIADEKERLNALAQHRSQSDKGAMAYLTVDPNNDRMRTIAAAPLREAMRRSLRIIRPATGGLCGNCPRDMDGEHALACMQSGEQTARHEFMKHALVTLAKRVNVHCTKEDSTPFIGTAQPDRRMDIVIAGGQM
jgi:hypothetical protein